MNTVPAIRTVWLVHHTFLNRPDSGFFARECPIAYRRGDTLAAIVVMREFVGDTHTSKGVIPIRAGVTEATMGHIPTMEACAIRQCSIPAIEIQAANCTIVVDLVKQVPF